MGSIRLENVTKQFGGRVVIDEVSLEFNSGEIVGLVGANGSGKTTLFRMIAGRMSPDIGSISISRGMDIGYLSQEPDVNLNNTLHDEAAGAFAEIVSLEHKLEEISHQMSDAHDRGDQARYDELVRQYDVTQSRFVAAGGYGVEKNLHEILYGLGFTEADYKLPMSALSGGQKCRVALAKLLAQDASFLLLDEPTNHLDIDAVRWLEKFLANHHGGAVIISHDRYLLDRVAQRIVEVDRARVRSFAGNYTAYQKTKAVDFLTLERQFVKDQEFIAKERDFIARHLAGQRSQEAKGRRTRLQRAMKDGELLLERPVERKTLKLEFKGPSNHVGEIITGVGLSKSYGEKRLFEDMSFRVSAGQRVGITGPNGTGKSTLLKILLGRVTADAGGVQIAPKISIGYYAQEAVDLDQERTILQEIQATRPELDELRVRNILGGFLFSGDDVFKHIKLLSGGEQSRVRLIKLILSSPSVLILDEPTNHLDIPSCEALEEALQDFPGTIITVSHDRYFLDRICNNLFVIRPEEARHYKGNYSFYIEQVEHQRVRQEAVAAVQEKEAKSARAKQLASEAKAKPKSNTKKSPLERMSLSDLETFVAEREARLAQITAQFADPSMARDFARLEKLQEEFDRIQKERDEAEQVWVQRSEEQA